MGAPGTYDSIVASSVIGHTPDLLGFLRSCETLLTRTGRLILAVPDKRHCFDVFQPLTSTGTVLRAHLDGRTRPAPGIIFDDVAYNAVRDGMIGWSATDAGPLIFFAPLQAATDAYNSALAMPGYRDVHVWRFVPSSFRLIAHDLNANRPDCAARGVLSRQRRQRVLHALVSRRIWVPGRPADPCATGDAGAGEDFA